MITHVAIQYKSKLYSLPAPNRHHHIILQIHEETGDMNIFGLQGFLDDQGNFLNRKAALAHAVSCKQLLPDRPIWGDDLYSENLW